MIASGGKVTVSAPGTPVAAITNLPVTSRPYVCHGVMFQALPSNQGVVYIGLNGLNKTTLANALALLAEPTDNVLPSFSAALTIAPNGLNLNDFYIDADSAGDGVLIAFLVT